MTKPAQPIRDTVTGKEYRSKYAAGKDLAGLVGGDPANRRVWYAVHRAHPHRFQRMDPAGKWVPHPYSDYYDQPRTSEADVDARRANAARSAERTRITTVEVDEVKLEDVRRELGTRTLRETVDRAFDEVLSHAALERSIEQLRKMDGLDLDKPEVMARAWR